MDAIKCWMTKAYKLCGPQTSGEGANTNIAEAEGRKIQETTKIVILF